MVFRWFFQLVLLFSAFTTIAGAQQPLAPELPVFRLKVRVEVVDAQVIEKKTQKPVSGLTRDDFQLYEDGKLQEITSFAQDEMPLSIILLFDLTDSVRPVLKSLSHGALSALHHLKPEDEIAVMTYAASAQLVQDFTTDRDLAASAIDKASRMESDEAAFFNEGMYRAAAQLARSKNPASRRVIIWFTDDVPNIPSDEIRARYGQSLGKAPLHTAKQAVQELLRTGTVVYTLLQRSRISDEQFSYNLSKTFDTQIARMQYPPGDVHQYSAGTGGHVFDGGRTKAAERLAEMIDGMHQRYALSYHPSRPRPPGQFCAIRVRLSPEAKKRLGDVVVEAKSGYYR